MTVATRFDSARQTYTLECKQSVPPTQGQPVKEPMVIPLALGLVGKDGRDLPLRTAAGETIERSVLVLDGPSRTVEFTGIAERPVLSINRDFSAPIKLVKRHRQRRSRFSCRPRSRSVQPLAGFADDFGADC